MYKFLCANITKSRNFTNSYKKLAQTKKYHQDTSSRPQTTAEGVRGENGEEIQENNEEESGTQQRPRTSSGSSTRMQRFSFEPKLPSLKNVQPAPSLKMKNYPRFYTGNCIIVDPPTPSISKKYYHVYSINPPAVIKRFYGYHYKKFLSEAARENYRREMEKLLTIEQERPDFQFKSMSNKCTASGELRTKKPNKKKPSKTEISYPTHTVKHNLVFAKRYRIREGSAERKIQELEEKFRKKKRSDIQLFRTKSQRITYPKLVENLKKGKFNVVSIPAENENKTKTDDAVDDMRPHHVEVIQEGVKIPEDELVNVDKDFEALIKSHPTIENASKEVKMRLKTKFVQLLFKTARRSIKYTENEIAAENRATDETELDVADDQVAAEKTEGQKESNAEHLADDVKSINFHPQALSDELREKDYMIVRQPKRVWVDESNKYDLNQVCVKEKFPSSALGLVSSNYAKDMTKPKYQQIKEEAQELSQFVKKYQKSNAKSAATRYQPKTGKKMPENARSRLDELRQERLNFIKELEQLSVKFESNTRDLNQYGDMDTPRLRNSTEKIRQFISNNRPGKEDCVRVSPEIKEPINVKVEVSKVPEVYKPSSTSKPIESELVNPNQLSSTAVDPDSRLEEPTKVETINETARNQEKYFHRKKVKEEEQKRLEVLRKKHLKQPDVKPTEHRLKSRMEEKVAIGEKSKKKIENIAPQVHQPDQELKPQKKRNAETTKQSKDAEATLEDPSVYEELNQTADTLTKSKKNPAPTPATATGYTLNQPPLKTNLNNPHQRKERREIEVKIEQDKKRQMDLNDFYRKKNQEWGQLRCLNLKEETAPLSIVAINHAPLVAKDLDGETPCEKPEDAVKEECEDADKKEKTETKGKSEGGEGNEQDREVKQEHYGFSLYPAMHKEGSGNKGGGGKHQLMPIQQQQNSSANSNNSPTNLDIQDLERQTEHLKRAVDALESRKIVSPAVQENVSKIKEITHSYNQEDSKQIILNEYFDPKTVPGSPQTVYMPKERLVVNNIQDAEKDKDINQVSDVAVLRPGDEIVIFENNVKGNKPELEASKASEANKNQRKALFDKALALRNELAMSEPKKTTETANKINEIIQKIKDLETMLLTQSLAEDIITDNKPRIAPPQPPMEKEKEKKNIKKEKPKGPNDMVLPPKIRGSKTEEKVSSQQKENEKISTAKEKQKSKSSQGLRTAPSPNTEPQQPAQKDPILKRRNSGVVALNLNKSTADLKKAATEPQFSTKTIGAIDEDENSRKLEQKIRKYFAKKFNLITKSKEKVDGKDQEPKQKMSSDTLITKSKEKVVGKDQEPRQKMSSDTKTGEDKQTLDRKSGMAKKILKPTRPRSITFEKRPKDDKKGSPRSPAKKSASELNLGNQDAAISCLPVPDKTATVARPKTSYSKTRPASINCHPRAIIGIKENKSKFSSWSMQSQNQTNGGVSDNVTFLKKVTSTKDTSQLIWRPPKRSASDVSSSNNDNSKKPKMGVKVSKPEKSANDKEPENPVESKQQEQPESLVYCYRAPTNSQATKQRLSLVGENMSQNFKASKDIDTSRPEESTSMAPKITEKNKKEDVNLAANTPKPDDSILIPNVFKGPNNIDKSQKENSKLEVPDLSILNSTAVKELNNADKGESGDFKLTANKTKPVDPISNPTAFKEPNNIGKCSNLVAKNSWPVDSILNKTAFKEPSNINKAGREDFNLAKHDPKPVDSVSNQTGFKQPSNINKVEKEGYLAVNIPKPVDSLLNSTTVKEANNIDKVGKEDYLAANKSKPVHSLLNSTTMKEPNNIDKVGKEDYLVANKSKPVHSLLNSTTIKEPNIIDKGERKDYLGVDKPKPDDSILNSTAFKKPSNIDKAEKEDSNLAASNPKPDDSIFNSTAFKEPINIAKVERKDSNLAASNLKPVDSIFNSTAFKEPINIAKAERKDSNLVTSNRKPDDLILNSTASKEPNKTDKAEREASNLAAKNPQPDESTSEPHEALTELNVRHQKLVFDVSDFGEDTLSANDTTTSPLPAVLWGEKNVPNPLLPASKIPIKKRPVIELKETTSKIIPKVIWADNYTVNKPSQQKSVIELFKTVPKLSSTKRIEQTSVVSKNSWTPLENKKPSQKLIAKVSPTTSLANSELILKPFANLKDLETSKSKSQVENQNFADKNLKQDKPLAVVNIVLPQQDSEKGLLEGKTPKGSKRKLPGFSSDAKVLSAKRNSDGSGSKVSKAGMSTTPPLAKESDKGFRGLLGDGTDFDSTVEPKPKQPEGKDKKAIFKIQYDGEVFILKKAEDVLESKPEEKPKEPSFTNPSKQFLDSLNGTIKIKSELNKDLTKEVDATLKRHLSTDLIPPIYKEQSKLIAKVEQFLKKSSTATDIEKEGGLDKEQKRTAPKFGKKSDSIIKKNAKKMIRESKVKQSQVLKSAPTAKSTKTQPKIDYPPKKPSREEDHTNMYLNRKYAAMLKLIERRLALKRDASQGILEQAENPTSPEAQKQEHTEPEKSDSNRDVWERIINLRPNSALPNMKETQKSIELEQEPLLGWTTTDLSKSGDAKPVKKATPNMYTLNVPNEGANKPTVEKPTYTLKVPMSKEEEYTSSKPPTVIDNLKSTNLNAQELAGLEEESKVPAVRSKIEAKTILPEAKEEATEKPVETKDSKRQLIDDTEEPQQPYIRLKTEGTLLRTIQPKEASTIENKPNDLKRQLIDDTEEEYQQPYTIPKTEGTRYRTIQPKEASTIEIKQNDGNTKLLPLKHRSEEKLISTENLVSEIEAWAHKVAADGKRKVKSEQTKTRQHDQAQTKLKKALGNTRKIEVFKKPLKTSQSDHVTTKSKIPLPKKVFKSANEKPSEIIDAGQTEAACADMNITMSKQDDQSMFVERSIRKPTPILDHLQKEMKGRREQTSRTLTRAEEARKRKKEEFLQAENKMRMKKYVKQREMKFKKDRVSAINDDAKSIFNEQERLRQRSVAEGSRTFQNDGKVIQPSVDGGPWGSKVKSKTDRVGDDKKHLHHGTNINKLDNTSELMSKSEFLTLKKLKSEMMEKIKQPKLQTEKVPSKLHTEKVPSKLHTEKVPSKLHTESMPPKLPTENMPHNLPNLGGEIEKHVENANKPVSKPPESTTQESKLSLQKRIEQELNATANQTNRTEVSNEVLNFKISKMAQMVIDDIQNNESAKQILEKSIIQQTEEASKVQPSSSLNLKEDPSNKSKLQVTKSSNQPENVVVIMKPSEKIKPATASKIQPSPALNLKEDNNSKLQVTKSTNQPKSVVVIMKPSEKIKPAASKIQPSPALNLKEDTLNKSKLQVTKSSNQPESVVVIMKPSEKIKPAEESKIQSSPALKEDTSNKSKLQVAKSSNQPDNVVVILKPSEKIKPAEASKIQPSPALNLKEDTLNKPKLQVTKSSNQPENVTKMKPSEQIKPAAEIDKPTPITEGISLNEARKPEVEKNKDLKGKNKTSRNRLDSEAVKSLLSDPLKKIANVKTVEIKAATSNKASSNDKVEQKPETPMTEDTSSSRKEEIEKMIALKAKNKMARQRLKTTVNKTDNKPSLSGKVESDIIFKPKNPHPPTKSSCSNIVLPMKNPRAVVGETLEQYESTLHKPVGDDIKTVPKEILEMSKKAEQLLLSPKDVKLSDPLGKYRHLKITYMTVTRPATKDDEAFLPGAPKNKEKQTAEDEMDRMINYRFNLLKKLNEDFKKQTVQQSPPPHLPETFRTTYKAPMDFDNLKLKDVKSLLEKIDKVSNNEYNMNMNLAKVLVEIKPIRKVRFGDKRPKTAKKPVLGSKNDNDKGGSRRFSTDSGKCSESEKKDNEKCEPEKPNECQAASDNTKCDSQPEEPNECQAASDNTKCDSQPEEPNECQAASDNTKCDSQPEEPNECQAASDNTKCDSQPEEPNECQSASDNTKCELEPEKPNECQKPDFDIFLAVPHAFEAASPQLEEERQQNLYYQNHQMTFLDIHQYLDQQRAFRQNQAPKDLKKDESKSPHDEKKPG